MPNLIESLAQDRHAARYQAGSRTTLATRGAGAASLESTSGRAGWLLVGLGLPRRALPGSQDAVRRITLIGR